VQEHTDSPVIEALQLRRSVPRVHSDRPPRELVERVIAAAGWAPNHYHTEPWRFIVLAGKAREELGEVMASVLREALTMPQDPRQLSCSTPSDESP
jgi:nitroreductase